MDSTRLVQFQCDREGTLFYYQHSPQGAQMIVSHCPACGSKKVSSTGRLFPAVEEGSPTIGLAAKRVSR